MIKYIINKQKISDLLDDFAEETRLYEQNNAEEERAGLIADYETDIHILKDEVNHLRALLREFLNNLERDLIFLQQEAYND